MMEQTEPVFSTRTDLSALNDAVYKIRSEIAKVIVGQAQMVDLLLAGILSGGHVLIEGVPGVAKTLTAKLLAKSLDVPFSRIQFTPDLMPSDVLGTSVFNPRDAGFEFRPGPIFSSVVLIDEINRAPAKTQAALFEVMEERQVTVDGKTNLMSKPFMVIATQNPVEHEGTYRLPEAQLDRFIFKINVPYPTTEEEVKILSGHHQLKQDSQLDKIEKVLTASQIENLQQQIRQLHVEEKLLQFIAKLVTETRSNKSIFLGASPRASIAILNASKAIAAMHSRDFVTPDDILFVVPAVLRHRIVLTPEKEMEGIVPDEVIQQMVQGLEIPR
ncbi:MAG: MoxR family ATPase [Chitinophagaceae bacterium]|nr:MoxR family ATPase [Chitinophagaceae bacterium]